MGKMPCESSTFMFKFYEQLDIVPNDLEYHQPTKREYHFINAGLKTSRKDIIDDASIIRLMNHTDVLTHHSVDNTSIVFNGSFCFCINKVIVDQQVDALVSLGYWIF